MSYRYRVIVDENGEISSYEDASFLAVALGESSVLVKSNAPFPSDLTGYRVIDIANGLGTLLTPDQVKLRAMEEENEHLKQKLTETNDRIEMTETALLEISDAVLNFNGGGE